MNPAIEAVLSAAIQAPSGDNTQPWKFSVDEASGRIGMELDPDRDPSPMNAGQRMARIALGAALENMLRVARDLGWEVNFDVTPSRFAARVFLRGEVDLSKAIDPSIARRVTNRRPYDGRLLAGTIVDRLTSDTPAIDGVVTHWVVNRVRLERLADLIGRADALMFGEPAFRNAFLKNVRFDAPNGEEVAEGLSIGSLEVSRADRIALKIMRTAPDWLLKMGGASKVFAKKARQAVLSASGLCIVSAPDRLDATDLRVGRALQRAWLSLTREELAAQPMMSLPVLDNLLEKGSPSLIDSVGKARIEGLVAEFRAHLPAMGDGRVAWIKRFGYAPAPTGRTGRRPLAALVEEARAPEVVA